MYNERFLDEGEIKCKTSKQESNAEDSELVIQIETEEDCADVAGSENKLDEGSEN